MQASTRPVVKSSVVCRPIFDGEAILVDIDTSTSVVLKNPTAVLIWSLVDGQRTVEEIIAEVRRECPDAPPTAADDVVQTLGLLAARGYLDLT